MKKIINLLVLIVLVAVFNSCEKDEGLLPEIDFKTGGNYVSKDATLPGGSTITIGIEASKSEGKDVLTKFNISESVNGDSNTSVFDKSLAGDEGDMYEYDYTTTLNDVSGQTTKYTFTVTNRDGLVNQVSLTVTVE